MGQDGTLLQRVGLQVQPGRDLDRMPGRPRQSPLHRRASQQDAQLRAVRTERLAIRMDHPLPAITDGQGHSQRASRHSDSSRSNNASDW